MLSGHSAWWLWKQGSHFQFTEPVLLPHSWKDPPKPDPVNRFMGTREGCIRTSENTAPSHAAIWASGEKEGVHHAGRTHPVAFALTVALILIGPLWQFPKQFWNLLKSFCSSWMILCVVWLKKKKYIYYNKYPNGIILACCCVPSCVKRQPTQDIFLRGLRNNSRLCIFIEPWSSRISSWIFQAWLVLWDLQYNHKRKRRKAFLPNIWES